MAHAIELGDGAPRYRCRFVQHTAHVEENAAAQRLYGSFGTAHPGGMLRRFRRRKQRRNPANTHIIVHDDKLLALCEGGRPWRLSDDLSTLAEDDLDGALAEFGATFSAHPCVDPTTGELWNFGAEHGRHPRLHFYRWPVGGEATRVTTVDLPFPAMIHDFALTATSMVVVATPMVTPTVPLGLILGQKSFGGSLRYRPELGVFVGLIDRESGRAQWHRADPFLCFHIANAYDDDASGEVVIDLCASKDDGILSMAYELMRGPILTKTSSELLRLRVDRGGRPIRVTALHEHNFEFPRIADRSYTQPHQVIFGLTWNGKDMPRRSSAFDLERKTFSVAPLVADQWAGECVPIAKDGASSERDAWLLTMVLDARAGRTELHVLDAADLPAGPVAKIPLPHIVPFGFHGSWVPVARRC